MGKSWDGARIEERAQEAWEARPPGSRPDSGHPSRQGRSSTGPSPFALRSTVAGTYDTTARGNRAFQAWTEEWGREAFRVLKPGGHLLSFSAARTYHRMACGLEDAGFEIRDAIGWVYATGFPKNHDVSKAIDARLGAERETKMVVEDLLPGFDPRAEARESGISTAIDHDAGTWARGGGTVQVQVSVPASEEARRWAGGGTALKPAIEPIAVARKPFLVSVAENVLEHGTGAIYVGDRMLSEDDPRWPANLMVGHLESCEEGRPCEPGCQVAELERQARNVDVRKLYFVPKPSSWERDAGLGGEKQQAGVHAGPGGRSGASAPRRNIHPTVKPVDLMRRLVRMVAPPGGTVLDPFVGSGTTGCAAAEGGWRFIGIDLDEDGEYLPIAEARIRFWGAQQTLDLGV